MYGRRAERGETKGSVVTCTCAIIFIEGIYLSKIHKDARGFGVEKQSRRGEGFFAAQPSSSCMNGINGWLLDCGVICSEDSVE